MSGDSGHVTEQLDDFVHGLLDEAAAQRVEAHCDDCGTCREELERAQARKSMLEDIPMSEASEELIQSTVEGIDRRETRRGTIKKWYVRTVLALTATAALIVAGFHWHYAALSASPYDLRVLGQAAFHADSRAGLRVAVFDRSTNRGVAGVPVTLALWNPNTSEEVELATVRTDAAGIGQPQFQVPDWNRGDYELRVVAQTDEGDEAITRSLTLKRAAKLMLSTDKPVYQPGQTIHVRSLGLRKPELRPAQGEPVEFWIADPKGNVIFRKTETASDYGIAAVDCPLAREINQGPYTVNCRLGDTESSLTVKVEKYVLPKFKVSLTLDRPWYQPGDRVKGTVQADYFFGKPVAEGTYELVVQTQGVEVRDIHRVKNLKLDEQGHGEFDFLLPRTMIGREQREGRAEILVAAIVTDTAGQQQTVAQNRVVTDRPITVEVIPENGTLVRNVENRVYLFASYPDGKPAQVTMTLSGDGIGGEVETNAAGVASVTVKPKTEEVGLTLRAVDEAGLVGRKHVTLTCGDAATDFLIRTDKAVYEGGETVEIVALGGGVEPVFLDFLKDGQTVLSRTVEMENGRGETAFDLPPELFGTLQLCAYRYGVEGLPVMKTRTLQVARAGELTVTAELDRDEYRPSESATLRMTLTDEAGEPAVGAISLAAVDEAVFSVLGQRPGLQERFFQLEQELLEPVYQIYDWEPGVPRNDVDEPQQQLLEAALFSRTAQPVAEPLGGLSPINLEAETYKPKVAKVLERRQSGLDHVHVAWKTIGWAFAIACVIAIPVLHRNRFVVIGGVLVGVVALMVLIAITQTPMYFAREAARRGFDGDGAAGWENAARMDGAMPGDDVSLPLDIPPDGTEPVRVREFFPETLLWRPELITDERGVATLDVALADSITTWRISGSAVTGTGKMGTLSSSVRVFQPFFVDIDLPAALTRNDEVAVPVVVYNYRDEPTEVELTLQAGEWFELLDGDAARVQTVTLDANEVRSVHYRLRAAEVGAHHLEVAARGAGAADAIRREIEVVPDGRRVETIVNASLVEPLRVPLEVPENAVPGSAKTIVKFYPSNFSELVEGLDGIFQRPSGCFEQTSSTTYPNVLALDYLKRTKQSAPEVEAKARQYIHLGYQRLLSFEVSGGGFDWFGNPPANETLTAYGLMEFTDMAAVHDVDPDLIQRTRNWLLAQRGADGVWKSENMLNDGLAGSVQRGGDPHLATTAYVAWAVFRDGAARDRSQVTLDYLLSHSPQSIENPYVLATVVNALLAIDPDGASAAPYLERLIALRKTSDESKRTWWELGEGRRTTFHGSGRAGDIETTALAALALLKSGGHAAVVREALNWLIDQKDARGTWHTTQATVLTLKALILATDAALGQDRAREIAVAVDGQEVERVHLPAAEYDVVRQLNLSEHAGPGSHELAIDEQTDTGLRAQVIFSYHVPKTAQETPETEPLTIEVAYDSTSLNVNDTVAATASVTNNMPEAAPMVIVDLPIPAGFRIDTATLDELVRTKRIAKYQLTPRSAVIYLRELQPSQRLELPYRLEATMPVRLTVPGGTVYEYYNPERRGRSTPVSMRVKA